MCKNQPPPLYSLHMWFLLLALFYPALLWSGAEGYFFQGSLVRGLFSHSQWHNGSYRIEEIPALLNLCIMSAEWNTLTDSHSPLFLPPPAREKGEKVKYYKKEKEGKNCSHTGAQWLPFPPVSFVNHCLLCNLQKRWRWRREQSALWQSLGGRRMN